MRWNVEIADVKQQYFSTPAPLVVGNHIIVGVGGGSGTLNFKGKRYGLSISGVSAGTIGVASMNLVGTATNLRTAADIAGSYSVASAGLAVAGGGKVATLQNSNGVVLQLQGRQVGFEASLAVSGLTIALR